MNKTEVFSSVLKIAQGVFNRPDYEFTESTTAADIHEWDSLSNIELIVSIESEFEIRFDLGELQDLPDLGALISLVVSKKL